MSLLDDILAPLALTTVFQPIVDFGEADRPTLHGYEALTRGPHGTHAEGANVLFEYVRLKRAEPTVDRACVLSALRAARAFPVCPTLSLNVHASTLGQDEHFGALLLDTAAANGFEPEQLVIEVVEQSSAWNSTGFARALDGLRGAGIAVALDDFGVGHSNFQLLVDIRPDYVKIDRCFVAGSPKDRAKRAVLRSIAELAREVGATVVAEGVETPAELAVVRDAGIRLVQGYLLSPPRAAATPYELPAAPATAWSLSA